MVTEQVMDSPGWNEAAPRSSRQTSSLAGGATDAPDARDPLAGFLGWFSIGLGLSQVIAPRRVASAIGLAPDAKNEMIMRLIGVRELACGIGVLSRPGKSRWLGARAAGDVLDLGLLAASMTSDNSNRKRIGVATAAVLGVTLLDLMGTARPTDPTRKGLKKAGKALAQGMNEVQKSITVNRSVNEVYLYWRNFENLPRFMSHLESVEVLENDRSRWRTRAPLGASVSWEAEMLEDRPGEYLSWQSVGDADVPNSGLVRFVVAPGNQGTEVHVTLRYDVPGGALGRSVAKLLGEAPEQQIQDDLRAFKQLLETGEIVKSDATLAIGRLKSHAAQPSTPPEIEKARKSEGRAPIPPVVGSEQMGRVNNQELRYES